MTGRGRLTGVVSSSAARDDSRCPTGIAIALGAVALIAAAFVAAILPPEPGPRLALMVAVVTVFGALSGDGWAALAVAGLAWLIGNGFLINRLGTLVWHGRVDMWFVICLLAAVSVGMTAAQIRTARRAQQRMRPFADLLHGIVTAPGPAAPPAPGAAPEPHTTQRTVREK